MGLPAAMVALALTLEASSAPTGPYSRPQAMPVACIRLQPLDGEPLMTQPAQPAPTAAGDEVDLLRRLRAGEDGAFEQLVRAHGGRLLTVTRRITRSEHDAEDAVQEAFLSAFRSLASFDGRSTLGTWLHRIAVNCALMKARGKHGGSRSIEDLLPVFEEGMHKEHPVPWTDTGDANAGGEGSVWEALSQLPDEYRDVLVLRDVEGLESKSVAAALGIGDALVRQRLHRGRQAMIKLLQPSLAKGTT